MEAQETVADDIAGNENRPLPQKEPIRFHKRTLLIGAILVAAISYISLYVDLVVQQMQMGVLQFAPGAVGAFIIVYATIRAARKLRFLHWMNAADLLALYLMLFVGVFVCTRGLIEKLIPALAYIDGNATALNNYRELLFTHLNPALVVGNPRGPSQQNVTAWFFNGLPPGASIPWSAWVVPCLAWFFVFILVVVTFLCMAAILRQQWSDSEKLSFPQTVLPLQIFDGQSAQNFFTNRLTWAGIAIPCVIYTINGIHWNYPSMPSIPLSWEYLQTYLNAPWNGISSTSIYLSFAAVGFAYLLPTDLLLSLWFFFLLTRIEDAIAVAYGFGLSGMTSYPTNAYLGYQAAGSYVALVVMLAYAGRKIYVQAIRQGLRFQKSENDDNELMPRRVAVWGIIACFIGIIAWSLWAGISLWLAVLVWAIYLFVTSVVLARSVSQAGLLMTETSFRPGEIVGMFVSKNVWSAGDITNLSMLNSVFFRDMRGLFLALFMDAQEMAGGVRMQRWTLLTPIAIGIPIALVVGSATYIHLAYTHGANTLYFYGTANAGWASDDATALIRHGNRPFAAAPEWFMVGVAVTALLAKMRGQFAGFPLNPIGYALAPSWSMYDLWFSIFVTWVIKSLFLRYGSGKFYHRAIPFFLGMIVGEFGSIALWAILASVFHVTAPPSPLP